MREICGDTTICTVLLGGEPNLGGHNAEVDCASSLRAHEKRGIFGSNRAAVVVRDKCGLDVYRVYFGTFLPVTDADHFAHQASVNPKLAHRSYVRYLQLSQCVG